MTQQSRQTLINQQKSLDNQLRFTFMVLQHRIEERNYAEAIQQSAILSKIMMEMQRVSLELSQPEVQNDADDNKTG